MNSDPYSRARVRNTARGRRFARVVVLALVLASGATAAWAWATASTNPATSVAAASLAAPTGLGIARVPAAGNTCTSVTISWAAVPDADRYLVEGRTANAGWAVLAASHATTSLNYVATLTHRTLFARVTPLVQGSSWTGPPAAAQLSCGIGEIEDVQVTNPCSRSLVTWTAPTGANNYDVQRQVNGGGWVTVATNQAAATYSDTTVHAAGATVEYRVVPGNGATNGTVSNTTSVVGWQAFRVTSVAFGNVGALGTRNAGDTITMTFTKPVNTGTLTQTAVYTQRNGGTRGVYLTSTTASTAATQAGYLKTAASFFGTSVSNPGTVAWSGADTVWTWTSSAGGTGPTMAGALAGTWSLGTAAARARCAADGTTALTVTPAPTLSGRW